MKKTFILFLILISLTVVYPAQAATDTVNLTTNVTEYIIISITANDTIAFGNLTPGTPLTGSAGTEVSVTTSSQFGYDLSLYDSVAASNSALLHTDTTTRITDYAGTIGTPTSWSGTGLGFSLYTGTGKDAKWGTGTTYNDSNNKYAGVPQNDTIIMAKPGYLATTDTAYIGWKIDVPNDQKTGSYSGNVTISAIPKLN